MFQPWRLHQPRTPPSPLHPLRAPPSQDPARKRHLLRLWVEPEESRPLPHYYEDLKGGIQVEGTRLYVPLEAEG